MISNYSITQSSMNKPVEEGFPCKLSISSLTSSPFLSWNDWIYQLGSENNDNNINKEMKINI